jgi:AcrR family transcriptional regulator
MAETDRRIRRTRKALQTALMSLILKKPYDSITIQQILDEADIGRSTFYMHFNDKDALFLSGGDELRALLQAALDRKRKSLNKYEVVIGFSHAMFEHANEYRDIYYALLHTRAWPLFRQRLESILDELISRECKAEIQKLRSARSEVPVDLFVHYLTSSFLSVLTWWLDRRSRLSSPQINEIFRGLVLPTVDAVLT